MIITEGAASPIRVAVIGAGKITVDQHVPAIRADARFELAGFVSQQGMLPGVKAYADLAALLADPYIDAVAVNTPPQVRFEIARDAIVAGKHVMLEKPPAGTTTELAELVRLSRAAGTTLFTAWHSQHAPAVAPVRAWLADRLVRNVDVRWCENVRQWHPGQTWIWQAGGLGVFDPGINALSILSVILPEAPRIERGVLDVPANCQAPVAASLRGSVGQRGRLSITLDFLQAGIQTWSIDIETTDGCLSLAMGGAQLTINGEVIDVGPDREYPSLYARFADLIGGAEREIDAVPLGLVADAFLVSERRLVAPFVE